MELVLRSHMQTFREAVRSLLFPITLVVLVE